LTALSAKNKFMRQIDPKIIKERKKQVLQAVIHHFIKTARPVGSNILTDDYKFDLSPATIRNLMAELEDDGYLTHPHTSAGRVPTDKGYRAYVDSLMELQRLALEEEDRVRHEYHGRVKELEEILVKTSKVLSALSQYTGFVLTPKLERNKLKYVELLPVAHRKILVILVTHTGFVKHQMIEADIAPEKLQRLNAMLNSKLKGLTLLEAKQQIIEKIEEAEREERELFLLARELSGRIFDIEEEVYMDGTTNVLALPEFQDYEPIRCILRLSEQKDILVHILQEDLTSDKVKVMIGSENTCRELQNLSVVSTVYKDGARPIGVLGIIGPKRMEYHKMMALVSSVSKILNKLLSKGG